MMIERAKIESMLLVALGRRLATHGFELQPGTQEYHRPIDGGVAAFHLSFIEHADDFDVKADVAIRFHDLETLVNNGKQYLTAKEKKGTFSLGSEPGNLIDRRQRRWTIKSAADVEQVAKGIEDGFLNLAIPYIDKYRIRTEALEIFAGDDQSVWIHSPVYGERAKRAVGLAWLLKDEARLKQLIETKSTFLEQRKDCALKEFRDFA
jgi:hypothetical protein